MNMEKDIFKRYRVDFNQLIKYGFKKQNNFFIYSTNIMNNSFRVDIKVNNQGNVSGKIWDLNIDDEYTLFRIVGNSGDFVNNVRDVYISILNDIRNQCFIKEYFIFDQSNRVTHYIQENYSVKPEFLWSKFPGYGVFRNKSNNKWFGIIMNIDASKVNNASGELEIIDLRIDQRKQEYLLKKSGYYKAYHMNKENWITISLDNTISDNELFQLIDESFSNICKE